MEFRIAISFLGFMKITWFSGKPEKDVGNGQG
jgi:hypothetical protein